MAVRDRDTPAFGHGNHEQGGSPGFTKRQRAALAYGCALVRSSDAMMAYSDIAKVQERSIGDVVAEHAIALADALFDRFEEEAVETEAPDG